MLQLKAPGVYTQEIDSGVRAIGGAPTAVALFVGPTRSGIDGRRTRITSFADFERGYGGLDPQSNLSYSVLHFFANGGGEAWVVRTPPAKATRASISLKRDGGTTASITLDALGSGAAGGEIFVEVDPFGIGANPYETGATPHDKTRFNLALVDRATGRLERFGNVSTKPTSTRFVRDVVTSETSGSQLVMLTMPAEAIGKEGPVATGSIYRLKPVTGPAAQFAAAIDTTVTVRLRDAAGDFADAAPKKGVVWSKSITLYAKDEAKPSQAVAIAAQLKRKINEAIRDPASTAPAALKQTGVEVDVQEGARFLRLRVAAVAPSPDADRLSDATVTIDGGAFFTELLETAPVMVENVSRYRLGGPYKAAKIGADTKEPEVSAATAGSDGDGGLQPTTQAFKDAVTALDTIDPFFNTLCLPDLVRPKGDDPAALFHDAAASIYAEAARVCSRKFAFLLVDPFPAITTAIAAEGWKSADFQLKSDYAAINFPNIRVDDPLEPGSTRSHPPSGAIAGLYARSDARTGVWEAPAGTDAGIVGVYGPSIVLSDEEHGQLNPIGVNVIRKFPIYGTVAFGSRTVNGLDVASSDYKYVPVRRTANFIERSLAEGLRWAVHKPNGESLWAQIRLAANSFMQGLFRQGAFKGTSAREAYFVTCDGSTTTATDIQQGVVNLAIGFAPLRPAEFVVITLRQIVQAQS